MNNSETLETTPSDPPVSHDEPFQRVNIMKSWLQIIKDILQPHLKKPSKAVDILEATAEQPLKWWGNFLIGEEQSRYLRIGPVILCIDHYNQEWQFACRSEHPDSHYPAKTIKTSLWDNEIAIKPSLPDRSTLCRLEQPLLIPPSSELTLYASTPTWIRLEVEKPHLILDEFPTRIMADSWFGFNTLMGELCYAGPTLYSKADEYLQDSSLILTKISVVNPSRDSILIKELRIPLPQLSIYEDREHHLWTENVLILFESELPMTSILRFPTGRDKEYQLLSRSRHRVKRRFPRLFGL